MKMRLKKLCNNCLGRYMIVMSKKMQILKHLDKCKLQRVSPNIKPNKKNWKNSHMEIEIRKAESRKKKKKAYQWQGDCRTKTPTLERRLSWQFKILVPQSIVFLSLNWLFISLPTKLIHLCNFCVLLT